MNFNDPDAPQDSNSALASDNEQLAAYEQEIKHAVYEAANGKDAGIVLESLLAKLPPNLRAAIIRRFRFEMDEFNQATFRRKQEEEVKQEQQQTQRKGLAFGMAQAVLLMARGTYEHIRQVIGRKPDVHAQVQKLGEALLRSGVTPDLGLAEKLEQIQAQIIVQNQTQQKGERGR